MAEKFDVVDVIRSKRDKSKLTKEEIDWTIDAYTRGVVGDEQMAALAMAIFLNGMDREEISQWTNAMIESGERMDSSGLGRITADKHSTGGVGDKITLPLAPLVAVYGVAVPQLSGRGPATLAVRSISLKLSQVGVQLSPTKRSCTSLALKAQVLLSVQQAPALPQQIRSYTHCVMSPQQWIASRSSHPRSCLRRSLKAPTRSYSMSRLAPAPS